MKKSINSSVPALSTNNIEITCGNCWGHQEYTEGYVDKTIDLVREQDENFISKFVSKYIKKT